MNWRKFFLISFCLGALTACGGEPGVDANDIRIGELVSLSGSESTYGQSSHRGITLHLEEVNARGGLKIPYKSGERRYALDLISRDNESRKDQNLVAIKKLLESDNVLAVIGEVVSERTKLAAPHAQKARVPMITPASTNPSITEIGDHIFRACYVDPFQGYVMAKFARQHLKLSQVAVLKDFRSNYSTGLSEYFIDTFIELGGKIVAEESYSSTDIDFENPLKILRDARPEAIFIPGYYAQVVELARQIRKNKITSKTTGKPTLLLGGDGWDSPELYTRGGDAILGGYFSNHFTAESLEPVAQQFVKKYTQRFGEKPDGTAAMGYDAAGILTSALKRALIRQFEMRKYTLLQNSGGWMAALVGIFMPAPKHNLRELLRIEISKTKNYAGVTGLISLNENRDAVKPAVILQVKADRSVYVTTVNP